MATLRWLQPEECPIETPCTVEWWNIYSQEDGGPPVVTDVWAVPDPETGIHEWTGELNDGWYTMTAENSGGESDHSNPIFLPEPGFMLGMGACLLLLAVLKRFRRA